jgi:hypothetical protein
MGVNMTENFTKKDGISLQEYFEAVLAERDKALGISQAELSRRLDLLNGEAERLRNIQATYLPREVADARNDSIMKIIIELQKYQATMEGKASQTSLIIVWVFSIASLIIGVIGLFR